MCVVSWLIICTGEWIETVLKNMDKWWYGSWIDNYDMKVNKIHEYVSWKTMYATIRPMTNLHLLPINDGASCFKNNLYWCEGLHVWLLLTCHLVYELLLGRCHGCRLTRFLGTRIPIGAACDMDIYKLIYVICHRLRQVMKSETYYIRWSNYNWSF